MHAAQYVFICLRLHRHTDHAERYFYTGLYLYSGK
jgi:hypothetical protein